MEHLQRRSQVPAKDVIFAFRQVLDNLDQPRDGVSSDARRASQQQATATYMQLMDITLFGDADMTLRGILDQLAEANHYVNSFLQEALLFTFGGDHFCQGVVEHLSSFRRQRLGQCDSAPLVQSGIPNVHHGEARSPISSDADVRSRVESFWAARHAAVEETVTHPYAEHRRLGPDNTEALAALFLDLPTLSPVRVEHFELSMHDVYEYELLLFDHRVASAHHSTTSVVDAINTPLNVSKLLPFFSCRRV